MLEAIRKAMRCPAVIYCGPGHQSSLHCERVGLHDVHYADHLGDAVYWRGGKPGEEEVFTGYFDESPLLGGDE
jgi:hypothetical protein